jgi:hypothetical protein
MRSQWVKEESGAVAAMTALLLAVFIGISGLGLEIGYWYVVKRSMQGAADAAAIEAAAAYSSGNTGGYAAFAKALAGHNGWVDGSGGVHVAVNMPPLCCGSYIGAANAIEVAISRAQPPFLARAVGYAADTTIAAHAVASVAATGPCVNALSTANNAIQINGNGVLNATNCSVSTKGDVAFGGNHSVLDASALSLGAAPPSPCVNNPTTQCNVPAGKVSQTGASDPLASASFTVPPATPATCTALSGAKSYGQGVYCTNSNQPSGGAYIFASGTFFKGAGPMSISGGTVTFGAAAGGNVFYFDGGLSVTGGTVTFNPGIYYVEGGSFTSNGNSATRLSGSGVTFVLTKNGAAGAVATLAISGQATITLTAPATGSTKGIVFFQDRTAPNSGTNTISGNGTVTITGAYYFPKQTVSISGNGVSASPCTELVANIVIDTGNGVFSNNCSSVGLPGSTVTQLVQ